jgi:hypothetical protein
MQHGSGQKRQVRLHSAAIQGASASIARRISPAIAAARPICRRCFANSRARAQLDSCQRFIAISPCLPSIGPHPGWGLFLARLLIL